MRCISRDSGNGCSGLEGLAHYRKLLLDRAPPALLGLGQNFNRFHVRARLKRRRNTTSKFKRYLVSGFHGGRPINAGFYASALEPLPLPCAAISFHQSRDEADVGKEKRSRGRPDGELGAAGPSAAGMAQRRSNRRPPWLGQRKSARFDRDSLRSGRNGRERSPARQASAAVGGARSPSLFLCRPGQSGRRGSRPARWCGESVGTNGSVSETADVPRFDRLSLLERPRARVGQGARPLWKRFFEFGGYSKNRYLARAVSTEYIFCDHRSTATEQQHAFTQTAGKPPLPAFRSNGYFSPVAGGRCVAVFGKPGRGLKMILSKAVARPR